MKPRSINHIVFNVKNIENTKNFYSSFLGEPETESEDEVIFTVGDAFIFFIQPEEEIQYLDKDRGGINHLAFNVNSPEDLEVFAKQLDDAGITRSVIKPCPYSGKNYIWFDDPDDYRLELYCH